MPRNWIAGPGRPLLGEIRVPGDKSISHRAVMLAAIAEGRSRITGFLEGEDTRSTARILAQLGVAIDSPAPSERIVTGVGLHGLNGANAELDCGNAGTGMRLLSGLLAGQQFESFLVGDASLSRRPMDRVIDPLTRMGARIDSACGLPPLRIHASNGLQPIEFAPVVASAQVKSAVLLAGLYARGDTTVLEAVPTRDYTERMLAAFSWPVDFRPGYIRIPGGRRLIATTVEVPSDFSSAAFFMVAGSLVPGSDLLLRGVGINPRRTGLLAALRMMGADIAESNLRRQGGEDVADLRVRSARLHAIRLPREWVADMIDEFPILFVAAALAEGVTEISGVAELRVKESDRLATMTRSLAALGADIVEFEDGATIRGGSLRGGDVDSHGDHRIAMSLAVAAQCASADVSISDCANVDTSFPGFLPLANSIGFGLAEQ